MPSSTSSRGSPNGGLPDSRKALEVLGLTGPVGHPVIQDVSLHVPRGALYLVLGPIHSGKSMLLRHLLGLERAERGTVAIDGERFDPGGTDEDVLRSVRTRIGVMFEGSALISRLSVLENVELPLLEHTTASSREARDTARSLLAEVGLSVDDETTPAELGRAEQRLAALARALALHPPLVLMDEPTLGLDPHAAAQLDEAVTRLQETRGFGALIVSHQVRYAFGRAEHIYVMADGRIVAQGDRAALERSDHPAVRRLLYRRSGP